MNLLQTLFNGTERASTRRRLSTWNDHQTCLGKCEMPKHRASKATVLTMSLDWELHAKTAFLSQIFEHSENESWQVHCQKKKAYKHNRNGQHSEAARSMKWAVVDMFAKSESGTREICSQLEKREKHTFDTSIFNISDQGPEKFPKWVSGISKQAYSNQAEGQEMSKNKCWELQHKHFWARAQQMPNMSLGIGHWKCPNEFRKPLNEYFRTM